METVVLHGRQFRRFISHEQLSAAIDKVADKVRADYQGKQPVFIVVLTGAFMFAAELLQRLEIDAQVCFTRLKSYQGSISSGSINVLLGIDIDLTGRDVVIIEDIVDSGLTMKHLTESIKAQNPQSVKICTMFHKPQAMKYQVPLDYVAMEIGNDFIVGFGLDYDGLGRNLKDIYITD